MTFTAEERKKYLQQGFDIDECGKLVKYKGKDVSVVIPEGVVEIGLQAFMNCRTMQAVVIPDTVVKIAGQAFRGCTQLQSINIPESVQTFGPSTFHGCSRLVSANLPQKITNLSGGMFAECRKLSEISLPDSITDIPQNTFWYCNSLKSFSCPPNVKGIGDTAFTLCEKLQTVELSSTLEEIGREAFCATKLKTINIPVSIKKIGNDIFRECDKLTEINYEGTKEQWDAIKKGERNDYSAILQYNVPFTRKQQAINYSDYEVCVGNKVTVEGKKKDEVGTAIEIKEEDYYYSYDVKEVTGVVESPVTPNMVVAIKNTRNAKEQQNGQGLKETIDPTLVRWWFNEWFYLPKEEIKEYKVGEEIDAMRLLLRRDLPDQYYASHLHEEVFSQIEYESDCDSNEEFQLELEMRWEPTARKVMENYKHAVIETISEDDIEVTLFFESIGTKRITKYQDGKISESNFLTKMEYNYGNYDYVIYKYPCLEDKEMSLEYYDIYLLDDASEQIRHQHVSYENLGSIWEEKLVGGGLKYYNYVKHKYDGDFIEDVSERIVHEENINGHTEIWIKVNVENKYVGGSDEDYD